MWIKTETEKLLIHINHKIQGKNWKTFLHTKIYTKKTRESTAYLQHYPQKSGPVDHFLEVLQLFLKDFPFINLISQ